MLYSKSSLPSILKVLYGQIDAALRYSCRLIVVVVVVVFVLVALAGVAFVDVVAIVVDADAAVVVIVLPNVAFFSFVDLTVNGGINKIYENFLHG